MTPKNLIISASGIRGIVGDSLSPELAIRVAKSFGIHCGIGTFIVGGDTRTSHDVYKSAVISGLTSISCNVIDIGKVTTPTVQQMVRHYNANGGIVITASHNPIIWNGIKLMNKSGSFMVGDEYEAFTKIYESADTIAAGDYDNVGTVTIDNTALDKHIDLILDTLETSSLAGKNLRILVDPNNGAGAVATPKLLDRLPITYDIINAEPNGRFTHNPEPVKGNLDQIAEALKVGNYDIGFVQDADADRLVILGENGEFIGEDYSLGLCVDYVLSEAEAPKSVVVNLSTSNVIRDIATKHDATFYQTKIGEPFVTQGIRDNNATVGGEGNGGVIHPKIGWGRDSLVGMVIALKHLAETGKTVTEIASSYPSYTMHRDKFKVASRDEIDTALAAVKEAFSTEELDTQDGVKVMFADSWIHIRPSNTEPIVRIFIEAPSQEKIAALSEKVKRVLAQ